MLQLSVLKFNLMKILKNILLLLILLPFSLKLNAQDPVIDSLKTALKSAKHDTIRVKILSDILEKCDFNDIFKYSKMAEKIAEKNIILNPTSKLNSFYLKHLANAFDNLGFMYHFQGDIPNSLDYLHKSLKIHEENKNDFSIALCLNNIGSIYLSQNETSKSIEYFSKSLKIYSKLNHIPGIALSLHNLGSVYALQGKKDIALSYFFKALKLYEKSKDKIGTANCFSNIGVLYRNRKDIVNALEHFNKSLKIQTEMNDQQGMAHSLSGIASVLILSNKLNEALNYAKKSYQIVENLGAPNDLKNTANTLKIIYRKQNRFKEALEMYELEMKMSDSISNEATKKASIKKQFQYQYEKKAAADSVKNAEEQKVKSALLTAQQAQLNQEKTKSYALYGGLALVIVFAGFMVNRFRVTHKQKQIIELKEIETQKQNEIITHQKHLVEEKHKEITDSINYAERIQRSFLATAELLDENLSSLRGTAYPEIDSGKQSHQLQSHAELDSASHETHNPPAGGQGDDRDYFVFFQPKDVVSGDFYWATSTGSATNKKFILCTADSTGHGVPGAIMSILNISCLEKSVEEEKLTEPAAILNHTRVKIIERLKKDGSLDGGKDGMDCSLICFDFNSPLQGAVRQLADGDVVATMTYAAANNPVWIVRNATSVLSVRAESRTENKFELIELSPDKMPVGKHDKDFVPFTQHSIDLQKGDVVYALTDGFADQFGGPKGKKFKYKQLKELLISNSQLPMYEQKEVLKTTLNNWKGNLEQVDDVTIIGIRI